MLLSTSCVIHAANYIFGWQLCIRSVGKTKVRIFSVWNEQLVNKSFIVKPDYNCQKLFKRWRIIERLMTYHIHTFVLRNLDRGPSTESFLAFGDLEYSKFLNSFLTFS